MSFLFNDITASIEEPSEEALMALISQAVQMHVAKKYEEARTLLEELLVVARRRHKYLHCERMIVNHLGLILQQLDYVDEALCMHYRDLDIAQFFNDKTSECAAMGNIARCLSSLKDCDKALVFSKQQLQLAKAIKNVPMIIDAFINIGDIMAELERIPEALEFFSYALNMSKTRAATATASKINNKMARCHYQQHNYIGALEKFTECAELANSLGDSNSVYIAHRQMAAIYIKINRIDEANKSLLKCIDIRSAIPDIIHASDKCVGEMHETLAHNLYDLESYGDAIAHAQEAIDIFSKLHRRYILGDDDVSVFEHEYRSYMWLMLAQIQLGSGLDALVTLEICRRRTCRSPMENVSESKVAKDLINNSLLSCAIRDMHHPALVLHLVHKAQCPLVVAAFVVNPKKSLDDFELVDVTATVIDLSAHDVHDVSAWIADNRFKMGFHGWAPTDSKRKPSSTSSHSAPPGTVTASAIKNITNTVVLYLQQFSLITGFDKSFKSIVIYFAISVAILIGLLLVPSLMLLTVWLVNVCPGIFDHVDKAFSWIMKAISIVMRFFGMQQGNGGIPDQAADTVVASNGADHIGESKNSNIAALDAKKSQIKPRFKKKGHIRAMLDNNLLRSLAPDDGLKACRHLYDVLLKPLEAALGRLCMHPDRDLLVVQSGLLCSLPISALMDESHTPLIARFRLRHCPSLAYAWQLSQLSAISRVVLASNTEKYDATTTGLWGKGDADSIEMSPMSVPPSPPAVPGGSNSLWRNPVICGKSSFHNLPPLLSATEEVEGVKTLLNDSGITCTAYSNDGPSIQGFTSALKNASLLHLSTYSSSRGALLLCGPEQGPDAMFRARNVYHAHMEIGSLHPHLVVLSAGSQMQTDEVYENYEGGLVKALQCCGVPCVVSALCDVPDDVTLQFMDHFYRALLGIPDSKAGPAEVARVPVNVAEAVRLASLAMLQSGGPSPSPQRWASFVVYGLNVDAQGPMI